MMAARNESDSKILQLSIDKVLKSKLPFTFLLAKVLFDVILESHFLCCSMKLYLLYLELIGKIYTFIFHDYVPLKLGFSSAGINVYIFNANIIFLSFRTHFESWTVTV